MLKKAALSLLVIGTSGAWVWSQSAIRSSDDLAAAPPAAASESPEAVAAVAVEPPLIVREFANTGDPAATAPFPPPAAIKVTSISIDPSELMPAAAPAEAATTTGETPRQPSSPPPANDVALGAATPRARSKLDTAGRPVTASAKIAARSSRGLTDGAYDGPAVDAFYGLVQIRANVQNGKLANIQVLQFPSDRRTSIAINRHALPMLTLEAIAEQSADVDAVSGATLTSEAFMESLGSALQQART